MRAGRPGTAFLLIIAMDLHPLFVYYKPPFIDGDTNGILQSAILV
jgi:hypothetical protein